MACANDKSSPDQIGLSYLSTLDLDYTMWFIKIWNMLTKDFIYVYEI